MKKNRILSLILSVMMMFTIVFPTGGFAEEEIPQSVELEYQEPVAEAGGEDVTSNAESEIPETDVDLGGEDDGSNVGSETPAEVTEQPETVIAEDKPVEESSEAGTEEPTEEADSVEAEEEELPFVQGYVRVNRGTTVYATESKKEEKGTFTEDAIVYAAVTNRAENEEDSWLCITFDTAEVKEADEALLSGYVQLEEVTVLSDKEVEQLIDELKSDRTVRSYRNNLLPAVGFKADEVEAVEVVEEIEQPVAETVQIENSYATATTAIRIVTDPENVKAPAGSKISFKVVAEGEGLTYRWQTKTSSTADWIYTSLVGYNTDTLSITTTAAQNGRQYRCIVTDEAGNSVTSNAATLTIDISITISDVTYEPLTDTTCAVISYSGSANSLVIPETVEGYTVTEIGEEAFMDNKYLVSIDLPDTITVIRARAFKNCSKLSEMK